MKIKNRSYLRGRDVRYYDHRLGAYSAQKSKVFLTVVTVVFLTGFSTVGSFGYQYYNKHRVLQRSDSVPTQAVELEEKSEAPQQPKPLQAIEDKALADIVSAKIKDMPKTTTWSVSLRDLKTGKMANVNSDTKAPAGALARIFMLPSLERKISPDNWKSRLGPKNVKECVTAMMESADNACALAAGNYIGWNTIDGVNQSLGFTNTSIKSKDSQVTTAREAADMLYRLQSGQVLSDKARRVFFDGIYDQDMRSGIPTGCGPDCLVGNLPAESGSQKNDLAVVKVKDSQYILSIMSDGATWQQVADVAYRINRAMLP